MTGPLAERPGGIRAAVLRRHFDGLLERDRWTALHAHEVDDAVRCCLAELDDVER